VGRVAGELFSVIGTDVLGVAVGVETAGGGLSNCLARVTAGET
jgi:hypothetical protein